MKNMKIKILKICNLKSTKARHVSSRRKKFHYRSEDITNEPPTLQIKANSIQKNFPLVIKK